ncbi:hypothetical protein Cgig2_010267 [Carnegiea gigantea]|uniref:Uncharacterized protein n=1 Tax=Carnegiea gigantea TaxID=171969 RepID=A0A9Q1KCJ8_9CARY|nr:hypothetical protein Cgig2_010267 [Carnegiea gigantea]
MYAAEYDEKDQKRGVNKKVKSAIHVTLQPLSKMGEKNTQWPLISIAMAKTKDLTMEKIKEEIISTVDKHPKFSQFELVEKCFRPQDHGHVVCFGHGVTPKDVWAPQTSKVDLIAKIQEKNEQIESLTGRVDALELNHEKKIKEMKSTHEVHMAEMKESHQQDMAKIEDTHHKDMDAVGAKLELLTKLVLHQRSPEMHSFTRHAFPLVRIVSGRFWFDYNLCQLMQFKSGMVEENGYVGMSNARYGILITSNSIVTLFLGKCCKQLLLYIATLSD